MASSLPDNPSLSRLRQEAQTLRSEVSMGAPEAVGFLRRHHPRPALVLAADRFGLSDAQLTVARGYGFSGWAAMERYLDVAAGLSVDPDRVTEDALSSADRFCALAVLRYTDSDAPPRWAAAAEILSTRPGLVDEHVWAAAGAADAAALARHLDNGDVANSVGGPFGWVPLLYLCFSRVEIGRTGRQFLDAATLLLDAGADPNAGYLWRGMATPFTALTGVFGEGEQGPGRQPRHPFAQDLAALLLDRGAHPVDQQTLYNRMFRADDSHLRLLFRYGLADAAPGPWERMLGEAMETREQMWRRQIAWAADHGFAQRLALLERHGVDTAGARPAVAAFPADPNVRDDGGATALHHAAWDGDPARIRQLLDAGADPSITDTRFGTTAQQWAEHAYQTQAAELLRSATRRPRA